MPRLQINEKRFDFSIKHEAHATKNSSTHAANLLVKNIRMVKITGL